MDIMYAWFPRTLPFLDVLIECELKQVIANSAVQSYTGDLWKGAIKVMNSSQWHHFIDKLII